MNRSLNQTPRTPLSEIKSQPSSGIGSLSEEDQHRFNNLVTKAKDLASQGLIKNALALNEKAHAIYNSEKLSKRIKKMQDYLAEYGESEEEDGDDMVHVGNNFYLFRDLYNKLYSHQREGVLWLWKLHKARKGGILGDDMGLGKTIQIISFLSGLFDSQQASSVLIVLPVAVIINWEKEFEKWAPGIRVVAFHGTSKRERQRALAKVQRRGGVVLTSYGMVISSVDVLGDKDGREFVWDYIILDEGHKIKNPSTKGSKALHHLGAKHRIILTGTPVQNNLKELWSLFDWTHQGTLLGTARTFSMQYEQPIVRARQKDATGGEQRLGQEIAVSLKKIITPYFMRRTKADVAVKKANRENNPDGQANGGGDLKAPVMPTFTRKNDLVCWVFLSQLQQQIYEAFVQTEEVRTLLNTTKSPLTALVILKKICDHPRLLNLRQCVELGIDVKDSRVQTGDMDEATARECAASHIRYIPDDVLIMESGKMVFLVKLLDNIRLDGHRALVFSQSRKMLDMIQKVITARGHKVARLDGTIRILAEREEIIKKFTEDKSYSVFLLTTQVGGVGLTLTSADRVVIFDPSWNPATDAQAVDRAFRIGQDKNVVIYRLITCGSIEEKIYRRQIFKDSITKQTTGDSSNPYRYFSRQELHELFVLDNPRYSNTQVQLMELHTNDKRKTDTGLDAHIAFLHSLEMFGISDHDLMFSQEAHNDDDDEERLAHGQDYIHNRVSKAQQAIGLESEENYQLTQQLGKYPAPEVNQIKSRRPATGAEDVPSYVRPPGSQPLIDVEALHQRSMELDSDHESSFSEENDINRSMKDLTVDKENTSVVVISRSPTPPPASAVHERSSRHEPGHQHSDMDSNENDSSYHSGSLPDENQENTSSFGTPPDSLHKSIKRRSDEYSGGENDAELLSSNKKGKHAPGTPSVTSPVDTGQESDDCDVMDLKPKKKGPELDLDQENHLASPVIRKRRPSVCNPNTPRKKFTAEELRECLDQEAAEMNVVREEIVFSPSAAEPVVGTSRSSNNPSPIVGVSSAESPTSMNETDNYEMFVRQIPMNSTVLSTFNKTKLSGQEDVPETFDEADEEEMEDDSGEEDEEGGGDDSQILARRRKTRTVIESSSGEEDENRENSSVEEMSNGSSVDDGNPNKQNLTESEAHQEDDTQLLQESERSSDEQENQTESMVQEDDDEETEAEDDEEEEEEDEEEELSEEDQNRYLELVSESRKLYKSGENMKALELALDALEVYSGDDRLQKYALRLKNKLMDSTPTSD